MPLSDMAMLVQGGARQEVRQCVVDARSMYCLDTDVVL
jgi:hypothetical protein